MDSFSQLIEQGTTEKLGISTDLRTAFKANLSTMIDANMQNRKDENSEKLLQYDQERDAILVYFFRRLRAELSSPDQETQEKAGTLRFIASNYYGVEKRANRQETQLIKGLLLDFDKAELKPLLEFFNLASLLPKLKKLNEDYEALLEHRTNEGVLATYILTKPLREVMDAQYEELTMKLFARNLLTPSTETQQAIANINKLIKATNTAWKQSRGQTANQHWENLEPEGEEEEETEAST